MHHAAAHAHYWRRGLWPPPLHEFLVSVQAPTATLLFTPAPRRRRNEVPTNFTPRRSGRIAQADRGLDSEMKAKHVLLRRLGLLKDDEVVSAVILSRYSALFDRPLAEDVIQAFADFYGWRLPNANGLLGVAPA